MDRRTASEPAEGIATARAGFLTALRRGDAGSAAEFYTVDARLLAPSAVVVVGPAAIARYWQAGLEAGVEGLELECEQIELEPSGGLAYEIGRYVMRMRPLEGAVVVDRGRYLLVHRREPDGSWRRAVETFNPDGSPQSVPVEQLAGRPADVVEGVP
jgi:ketosteroid isomerase-like protein